MPPPAGRPPAPDGGWGWVVVAGSFLALLLGCGSPQAVGVLYPEWLLAFGEGKAMTAWVGSLVYGVAFILGPFCSVCVLNFGARPVAVFSGVTMAGGLMLSAFAPSVPFLIFSYGVVVGVGVGLLYAAVINSTCLYFDKRRGLALGIMNSGTSVGGVLYAALQRELVQLLGLRGCLLVAGALALNVVACAGPMRPLTPPGYYLRRRAAILERRLREEEQEEEEAKQSPVRRRSLFGCSAFIGRIGLRRLSSMAALLRDRVLAALCAALFLFSLGSFPPHLFLEDVALSSGLKAGGSSFSLVSCLSAGSFVGKVALGLAADAPRVNGVFLYAATVMTCGLGVLLIPLSSSYLQLQVLALIQGFLGANWSLTPHVTGQVVGAEKLDEAHGILMFFGGVGFLLGPPIIGCFYDFSQSYDLAFYLSGGCMMAGGLILFLAAMLPPTQTPPPAAPKAKLTACAVTPAV